MICRFILLFALELKINDVRFYVAVITYVSLFIIFVVRRKRRVRSSIARLSFLSPFYGDRLYHVQNSFGGVSYLSSPLDWLTKHRWLVRRREGQTNMVHKQAQKNPIRTLQFIRAKPRKRSEPGGKIFSKTALFFSSCNLYTIGMHASMRKEKRSRTFFAGRGRFYIVVAGLYYYFGSMEAAS